MQIIPVIDLKGGEVVLAKRGERQSYRPVRSPLCDSSQPEAVVRAFRSIHHFPRLYIADLDAIAGDGDNLAVVERLKQGFPDLTLWLDNGLSDTERALAWLDRGLGALVLGSESQQGPEILEALRDRASAGAVVLSLDFRGDDFQGPSEILERSELWPADILVMTLARVGSALGPDEARLAAIQQRACGRRVFAAGGVRGPEDLRRLQELGVDGALIASALHDGRLDRRALAELANQSD